MKGGNSIVSCPSCQGKTRVPVANNGWKRLSLNGWIGSERFGLQITAGTASTLRGVRTQSWWRTYQRRAPTRSRTELSKTLFVQNFPRERTI